MPARHDHSSRAALTFVLLSVFIDSLGFGIIIPSMPSVIMELTGEPVSTAADWSGYLMAVYALLQFFMAPIFGNLSDRFGRRPMLLRLAVRVRRGFPADRPGHLHDLAVHRPRVRRRFRRLVRHRGRVHRRHQQRRQPRQEFRLHRRRLGLRLHAGAGDRRLRRRTFDPRAPFFVAAALALANVAFGFFALPESLPPERRRKFEWARANPFGAFKSLAHLPMVAGLLFAVFLYQMAHDSLPAVWMFYTQHKFGWGPAETGWSLTFVGIMTVIVMGGLTGYVVPQARRAPRHHASGSCS